MLELNKIYQGDCLEVLKTLPSESINCCMTSPPYWALRDYGVEGQLGLEPTFTQYINKLCDIFDEVKRVLRKDGTLWVNIGDTYGTKSGSGFANDNLNPLTPEEISKETGIYKANELRGTSPEMHKNLCNIPARFSIEMQNRGWILRNVIIWHKPNCMPSSVKDRFTVDFEYLYFFVKSKKYWFETQYEPTALSTITRGQYGWRGREIEGIGRNQPQATEKMGDRWCNPSSRRKRTVWTITTKPFKEAHFATYPEALCETPIKAGCPEFVCNKCGKPRKKILEHNKISEEGNEYLETNKTPYSIQERKGFVKVRKLPDLKEFSNYLNKNRNKTIEEVELIFGNQAPHHWFSGESYPSVEDYLKLKEVLGLDNTYDECMTKEYYKPAEKQNLDYSEIGYSDCKCNAGFSGGIVLDPFFGAGTTGLVAMKQNKNFIGIELSEEYCKMANERLTEAKQISKERSVIE